MKTVSRFESNLLKIVYCVFGKYSVQKTLPILLRPTKRPRCLSRDTVELVKQAISKGVTEKLASRCGWKTESFMGPEKPATGRLWQRAEPQQLGLEFSKTSLDLLIWMTASNTSDLGKIELWAESNEGGLTLGDQFFFSSVMEVFGWAEIGEGWRKSRFAQSNGLAVLMGADRFKDSGLSNTDFQPWVAGQGASIIEGMQSSLADSWVEMEKSKSRIKDVDRMLAIGHAQIRCLSRFMDAADSAGRRDLCRFLLTVLEKILEKRSELNDWTRSLDLSSLRIADRTEVYLAAAAVLSQAERLQKWNQESLTSGYLDENYASMQLWKTEWERLGAQPIVSKAIQIARQARF